MDEWDDEDDGWDWCDVLICLGLVAAVCAVAVMVR